MKALREGWAWTPRRWTRVTADTGVGDPRRASAGKGRRFPDDLVPVIGDFLVELAAADTDDLYADPENIFPDTRKE
jgi:creatinine amidohydrolase